MFADLCDYTVLNEACDPEDVDLLRGRVEELAIAIIHRHSGSVTQIYGDGFLAVFGYPAPSENDARRAVEAAIELHDAMRGIRCGSDLNTFEVRMHTGVHGGVLFAKMGDAVHGRYDLTGDTVNTAARLCAAAKRDEVLISEGLLSGIEGFFFTEPVADPLHLKGRKAPIRAHKVTARSAVETRYQARSMRGLTRLIGRELELAILEEALTSALDHRSQLLVVAGAAGLGKSRLLAEFRSLASARGFRVLSGFCETYGDTAPVAPFSQMLKQLFDFTSGVTHEEAEAVIGARLREWGESDLTAPVLARALFPSDPGAHGAPDARKQQAAQTAMSGLIKLSASRVPLAIALDDWQWADDSSRRLLDELYEAISTCASCVVVATRPTEVLDPLLGRAHTIALHPFDEAESARVVQTLRSKDPDDGVALALHRRSGGNPLFLEELCRALPAYALHDEKALAESGAPSTLQGVIQTRVAHLPLVQRRVLLTASVIGIEFTIATLARICVDPELDEALGALARADIIRGGELPGSFRFKHGITREVIYETVRLGERRRIHRAVAQVIRERVAEEHLADEIEALVYHYRGADDQEQAARFAELAGDRALAAAALDRARFHYTHALDALERLPRTEEHKRSFLRIVPSWALACAYNSARSQLALLERAAAFAHELGEAGAQANTQYSLGWIRYGLGNYQEACAHYRAALVMAESAKRPKLIEQLWANLGQAHAAAGNYREALPLLTMSIDGKRARTPGSHQIAQGYAYALACRASVHADMGNFIGAENDLTEALAAVAATEHPIKASVLAHVAMVALWRGDWTAGIAAAICAREAAERLRSPFVHATATAYEAYGSWMQQRTSASLNKLSEAVQWLERRDQGLFISLAYGFLAEVLVQAGEHEHARACAERLLERAEHGDCMGETAALRVFAQLHAKSEPSLARDYLARAKSKGEARGASRDVAITQLLAFELRGSLGLESAPWAALATALQAVFGGWQMDTHAARVRELGAVLPCVGGARRQRRVHSWKGGSSRERDRLRRRRRRPPT
ncbi:MAG: hypothetical protein JWN04_3912 [Myxococcaceae bacterium]|nr:hypothetical protein [Myxococcaceae bacterium]